MSGYQSISICVSVVVGGGGGAVVDEWQGC